MKRLRPWLPAVVGACAFAAFLPALNNGLVSWDDRAYLIENTAYQSLDWNHLRVMLTTFLRGNYQPVTWLSYALDFAVWGARPFGFHLTNLLLHAANAALFYVVGLELLRLASGGRDDSRGHESAALIAALLFAVHPLRAESVAWATQRRDVLSAFFYLITVLLYLRGRRLAVAGYALCLLSKALGMTMPAVLLLLDVYPLKRLPADPRRWLGREHRAVLLEKIPFVVLAAAIGLLEATAQRSVESVVELTRFGWGARLAQAAYGVVFYLWKSIVPAGLAPLYEKSILLEPGVFWACGAATVALTVYIYRQRRRWPALPAVWIYYLVTLLPALGLIKSGRQIAADRFTYLSCLGWALLAGAILSRGRKTAAAALIALFAILSWRQTLIWRDSVSLWSAVVAAAPENYFGRYNLAAALREAGRPGEASAEERTAIEAQVAILLRAGNLLNGRGESERAAAYYERALQLMPGLPPAVEGLETARRARGT